MNNPFSSSQTGLTNTAATASGSSDPNDGMVWWFRWLIKIVAVLFGFIALVLGFIVAISFSAKCLIAGIILIISSFIVLAFEVPMCCSFVHFIEPLAKFSESRPHWQKTVLYMIPPIVIICLCTQIAAILGSLCIVAVAALYFMLTVGKKAPLNQMRASATGGADAGGFDQLPK